MFTARRFETLKFFMMRTDSNFIAYFLKQFMESITRSALIKHWIKFSYFSISIRSFQSTIHCFQFFPEKRLKANDQIIMSTLILMTIMHCVPYFFIVWWLCQPKKNLQLFQIMSHFTYASSL